jgi:hypothetical protein
MRASSENGIDPEWRWLCIVGGIAPLLTLTLYLGEMILIPWEGYPTTAEQWLTAFERSKLQGLLYLNAPDVISIALLGIMFAALYVALSPSGRSAMAIALTLAIIGVSVFVTQRSTVISGVLSLSDQYAGARTDVDRAEVAAAARGLTAMGQATPQTIGFLFVAVASLIASAVMLRSGRFGRLTAYTGIIAGAITVVDGFSSLLLPSTLAPLMVLGGVFWVVWWVTTGMALLRLGGLGRRPRESGAGQPGAGVTA